MAFRHAPLKDMLFVLFLSLLYVIYTRKSADFAIAHLRTRAFELARLVK